MSATKFQCSFCDNRFVQEGRFLKHRCKEMERDEEFRTPNGQAAWLFYQKWMKAHRRKVPNPDAFLTSRYYTAFIKFATFTHKVRMPDVDQYIWLMTKDDIAPTMWTMDAAYARYVEFMDRTCDPDRSASITIDALFDMTEEFGCDITEVFEVAPIGEIIQQLRQRRLSPWLLMRSDKFKQFFAKRCSNEERMIIESIIRPTYWAEKFKKEPETVKRMKEYIEALAL